MEIKVTLTATPELLAALNKIATVFGVSLAAAAVTEVPEAAAETPKRQRTKTEDKPAETEQEVPKIEDVRAVMNKLPKETAKAMIQACGVTKLNEVPKEMWADLIEKAEKALEEDI